jgi:hypothetical protein
VLRSERPQPQRVRARARRLNRVNGRAIPSP